MHRIADGYPSRGDHGRVEAERPFESVHDVAKDVRILRHRIGIECGHDAACAQVIECDDRVPNSQAPSFPFAFLKPGYASDDQIWPQTSSIAAEGGERSIGRDQQWEDVEPAGVVASELCSSADYRFDQGTGFRRCPRMPVNGWLVIGAQGSLVGEQRLVRSRGDEAALAAEDLNDAIAEHAFTRERDSVERLATHRLHGIPADSCQLHHHTHDRTTDMNTLMDRRSKDGVGETELRANGVCVDRAPRDVRPGE